MQQTQENQTNIDVYLDGVNLTYTHWKFPGGEVGVKLTEESLNYINNTYRGLRSFESCVVHHHGKLWESDDYFIIANLFDAVDRAVVFDLPRTLDFEYFPFARQDRACHEGESFALRVFLDSLLALKIKKLYTADLHNEKPVKAFCSSWGIEFADFPQVACFAYTDAFDVDYSFIISPDAGAVEKAKKIKPAVPHIFLSKTRVDRKVVYEDFTDVELSGKVLVVDDICDGGGTFAALAEMLKRRHPAITEIHLYVTHGIFSGNYLDNCKDYAKIFCYNNMNPDTKTNPKFN